MARPKDEDTKAFKEANAERELEKKHDETVQAISNAISHLMGYAEMIEAKTGFKPIAINKCIKTLREILK